MNDVERRVRTDLDRTISAAPPPVPIETILLRSKPGVEQDKRPYRSMAMALPTFAAVAVALVFFLLATKEPGSGPAADIDTSATSEPDAGQPTVPLAVADSELIVHGGLWLSETIPQIADQLPGVTETQLWAALNDNDPRPLFVPATSNLNNLDVPGLSGPQLKWEGLLAPGTYAIDADSDATDVINKLHDEFARTVNDLSYGQASGTVGLSAYETVIVASLIETADPAYDDDRAKIAAVIHNRITEGLPIGLDSAYLYAAQDRNLTLTSTLLGAPGPYGIRTTAGLPPTPIATPTRASLLAAIDPAIGPWLFYFVGDDQDRYYFAATLAEHNANVAAAQENGLLD